MLNESTKEFKSDKLNLLALPSVLRNLSQLGRSGVLRFSLMQGFAYLELEEGQIARFIIPEDLFVDYLIERLKNADKIKTNIAELLISSSMNLKEFSLFLVKEKISTNAEIPALFMKFSKELLFSLFEKTEGTLDFNIRLDLISHIEPTAYSLNVSLTPGQLFLDYWEIREKYTKLERSGEQFYSNTSQLGTMFSPLERNIMRMANSGAYLEALLKGIFEAREEVIDTMLRLSQSGILLAEVSSKENEEEELKVELAEEVTVQDSSSTSSVIKQDRTTDILEKCLPLIVLAMIVKFTIEFKAVIYLIENAFPS